MSGVLQFRLNGRDVRVDSVSPNVTLARMVAAQRTDRLEGRLRRGRLWRVFGRNHRARCARQTLLSIDQQLSRPASAHGRTRHRDRGRRFIGKAAPGPGSDGEKFRIAMRLLHARFHHVDVRRLLSQGPQDRSAARRTALRQSLPMHRVSADPRCRRRSFRETEWRRCVR